MSTGVAQKMLNIGPFDPSEGRINRKEEQHPFKKNFQEVKDPTTGKVLTFNKSWLDYTIFGNINAAEMTRETGLHRAYHFDGGVDLLTSARLSLMALPGLILRIVAAVFLILPRAYMNGGEWRKACDPATDNVKDLGKCIWYLLSGALLGTAKLAISVIRDPWLEFSHEREIKKVGFKGKACLLIIDAQKDFADKTAINRAAYDQINSKEGDAKTNDELYYKGRLGVPDADQIVEPINKLRAAMDKDNSLVAISYDWHKIDHCSFTATAREKTGNKDLQDTNIINVHGVSQVLWPVHCVQGSKGAELLEGIDSKADIEIHKGLDESTDSYSMVGDNGGRNKTVLGERLLRANVQRIYVAGIASDVCVLATLVGLLPSNCELVFITDACKGVIPEFHQNVIDDIDKLNSTAKLKGFARIKKMSSKDLLDEGIDFKVPEAAPSA